MSDEWLTTEDAARLTGYHPNHIRRLLRAGELTGRKWGQAWQVSRASLVAYLEAARKAEDKRRGPKP